VQTYGDFAMSTSNSVLPIYGVDNMAKTVNVILHESLGHLPLSVSIHTWDDLASPAALAGEKIAMVNSRSTELQAFSGIHEDTIAFFMSASFTSMDSICSLTSLAIRS
jgi:hypothetical protein